MPYYLLNQDEEPHEGGDKKPMGQGFTDSQMLKVITSGDIIFLHIVGLGVKAAGIVVKKWNRVRYESPVLTSGDQEIGVLSSKTGEYHIIINWQLVCDGYVSIAEVTDILGEQEPQVPITRMDGDKGRELLQRISR